MIGSKAGCQPRRRPPSAVAKLQEIPETRGGQQGRAGALPLQQGVRRHGRPVGDLSDLFRRGAALCKRGQDAGGNVLGGRGHLVERESAVGPIADDEVGERSRRRQSRCGNGRGSCVPRERAGSYAVFRGIARRKAARAERG